MSIRRAQTSRVLEEVTRALYASGVRPTLSQILGHVAAYFAQHPAGRPLPIPPDLATARAPSSVQAFNQAIAHTAANLDVLYEVALEHVDEVLSLTSSLQAHLERLKAKRRRVEAGIDDYLLTLYNTDGYYYSASDTFADVYYTDLALTSAYIDTGAGSVVIPGVSSLSYRLPRASVGEPDLDVRDGDGRVLTIREIAPFSGALEDGLDNLVWAFEVDSDQSIDVIVSVTIPVGRGVEVVDLSRIDFTPYGVIPVQVVVETRGADGVWTTFGGKIATSPNRITFGDVTRRVTAVRLTLRKSNPDYNTQLGNTTKYRYLFGASEIVFVHQVYDLAATFVSSRLALPAEMDDELVIDAVTLTVDDEVPPDTTLTYYIAADAGGDTTDVSQFDWRRVTPVGGDEVSIVRFNGAQGNVRYIRSDPGDTELQLLPLDDIHIDPRLRNPSPALVAGVDIYRLCVFEEPALPSSLRLEEGVNTVRAHWVPLESDAVRTLSYWVDKLGAADTNVAYGRIDAGNDFFYGGDIGEGNVSVLVETYVESEIDRPTFFGEFAKRDLNSQAWDLRVYLNGREVGWLPAGTHRALLPWTLRQGLNHVLLLVNIPTGKSAGTVDLLGDSELYDYGTVKLATWSSVDVFDMAYNESGEPFTFTIRDGEIISRRAPTDNFRLTYANSTGRGPTGVRFRADLTRSVNTPTVSPRLNSYRLRFSYGSA